MSEWTNHYSIAWRKRFLYMLIFYKYDDIWALVKRKCAFGAYGDSWRPDQTARMRSLIRAFAVRWQNHSILQNAHVQDDVKSHILRILKGTFSLDADHMLTNIFLLDVGFEIAAKMIPKASDDCLGFYLPMGDVCVLSVYCKTNRKSQTETE